MTDAVAHVLALATGLPRRKREWLADEVWVTIPMRDRTDRPLSPAVMEEVIRRLREFERGEAVTIPMEEVMASLREELRNRPPVVRPPPDPQVEALFAECLALASALTSREREEIADRLWDDEGRASP